MAIGGDWYPRVWLRQLDVVCSHVCGSGRWMWLARAYIATTVECVWCPRVWPWQLDVMVTHDVGCASCLWFVTACVVVAVWCSWGPTHVPVTVECAWCSGV